ncbi:hypothetical protein K504DRAFT_455253 [Pleomassaria siparia CBS 279.74]|uniref:Myb-like domain-containing protein n=1 Tax=Pleomassaria siparia CBS 279.74 TaxID=1314801 RepID=A0A6G1K9H6_9PLEO|nr:hypothetical protein K504DRAFT_455253 [Pleomassaria siparia CBS 279.74]
MAEVVSQPYNLGSLTYRQSISPQSFTNSHLPSTTTANTVSSDAEYMAVPIQQRPIDGERFADNTAWTTPQLMLRGSVSYSAAPTNDGASVGGGWVPSPEATWWPNSSMMSQEIAWGNGTLMDPAIMPHSAQSFLQNGNLMYTGIVDENMFDKGDHGYNGGHPWRLSDTNGLPYPSTLFDGSDVDTMTASPKSVFSEASDRRNSFTSEAVVDYPSPGGSWVDTGVSSFQAFQSVPQQIASSGILCPIPQASKPSGHFDSLDVSGLQLADYGVTFPRPMTPVRRTEGQFQSRSDPSYAPNTSIEAHWYALSSPIFPSALQENSDCGFPRGSQSSVPMYPTPPRQEDDRIYAEERMHLAATAGKENNAYLSNMAEQAQRDEEDKILLEGKAGGLTYKEIRKKMQTRVAESTLRGRYRSLTKDRKNRVRKPVWTEKDLQLLREIVHAELNALGSNYRTSARGQKLARLSWKRVGEYIANNGGSYHFGNSTCKKKWSEIDRCR